MSYCACWWIHTFRPSDSPLSKLHFQLFRDLQTTLCLLWFADLLMDSHIIPSSVLHILHSNVSIYTIWHSGPYDTSGTRHPILKPVRPLSTLDNFLTYLWRIVEFAGSGNFKFLDVVSCALYLQISFQVYAICIQLLQKNIEKILPWNRISIADLNILDLLFPLLYLTKFPFLFPLYSLFLVT